MATQKDPIVTILCDGSLKIEMTEFTGMYGYVNASSYGPVVSYDVYFSDTSGQTNLGNFPNNPGSTEVLTTSFQIDPAASQYSVTVSSNHQNGQSVLGSTTLGSGSRNYGMQYHGFDVMKQVLNCGTTPAPIDPVPVKKKKGNSGK